MGGPGSFLDERTREIREEDSIVPFEYDELEQLAREELPDRVIDHVFASPGSGATRDANRRFDDWSIVPRVFRDVSGCSLETELFGMDVAAPVLCSPIGGQATYHEDGELASARAAAELSIPFSLSTAASHSIEPIAETMGDRPRLFQLYWTADWEVTASLLERAASHGYGGIMVTVDFQARRWIPADIVDPITLTDGPPVNLATDPVYEHEERDGLFDLSVSWEDLSFLREHTDLPIYLKGIVHPADARLAVEHGADGIVVSNHGGRQTDGTIGAIEALPDVIEAVDGEVPILLDSGVRWAADTFKALALGAEGVFVGRRYLLGLALAGERGAYETMHNLLAELESLVALSGCTSVDEIDRSLLRRDQ